MEALDGWGIHGMDGLSVGEGGGLPNGPLSAAAVPEGHAIPALDLPLGRLSRGSSMVTMLWVAERVSHSTGAAAVMSPGQVTISGGCPPQPVGYWTG